MASSEEGPSIIDLDEWVRDWPRVSEYLSKKNHRAEYDWSGVQLIWGDPHYDTKKAKPLKTSRQLFKSSAFNGDTKPQPFHFKAVKKTHSQCKVALFSAIKKDDEVETTLGAPTPAVEAGFPASVTFQDSSCIKFNEEIEFHINTPLTIEGKEAICLTVKSVEQVFASTFSLKVKVRGTVCVRIYKNDTFVTRIQGNFREIFHTKTFLLDTKECSRKGGDICKSGDKEITVTLKGRCHFQYIVDQRAQIKTLTEQEFSQQEDEITSGQQPRQEDAAFFSMPARESPPGRFGQRPGLPGRY